MSAAPKDFFNVAPTLNCVIDLNGKVLSVNNNWTTSLGFGDASLLGHGLWDRLSSGDRSSLQTYLSDVKSGSPNTFVDLKIVASDGSLHWLRWTAAIEKESGDVYVAAMDITKLMATVDRAMQLSRILDSAAIVASTDVSGRIVEVNEKFCEISGYSRDELIGENHRILNSGHHPKGYFANMWRAISSGKIWTGEMHNKSKSGRRYIVQSVIAPIFGAGGKIETFTSIRFDLTAQRLLEIRLEDAQKAAKIGSWSYDIGSNSIAWTKQMYDLFPEDAASGPPTYERHYSTIHDDDKARWSEVIQSCLKDGNPYRMRFRSVYPNGDMKTIEAIGHGTRDSSGRIIELTGTCQDVSEAVKAEEAIAVERAKSIQNAKLAELGEMSAGFAHEINNPLTIIGGMATMLPKIAQDHEKITTCAAKIQKSVDRINRIVSGLRKYSRTSGQDYTQVSKLKDIVEETLVLTVAKSRDSDVNVTFEPECDALIQCDDVEIGQVVINLVNNGVDAIKDLPVRWINIGLKEDGGEALLTIRDSGGGIPPAIREKMFQSFYTTKPVGVGTGLGLSIVKSILNNHKATISINPDDPHTCFEIRFPLLEKRSVA